mgnify:CR=1 FL=1
MSKGLTCAPIQDNNELIFFIEDSNGDAIHIKQTVEKVQGKQVWVTIDAAGNVNIVRGGITE